MSGIVRRHFAALILWILLLPVVGAAAPSGEAAATLQTASGPVTVQRRGTSVFVPLQLRADLYAGDVVRAAPNAKGTVLFSDGAQVRLNAGTTIEIRPAATGGQKSLFRVLSGEVWSRLRPGEAIQTRSAVAGVRGTEVNLVVDDEGVTTLTVIEGEVDFTTASGSVVLGAAQQSIARPGASPAPPAAVPNPTQIIEWTLELDRAAIPREKFFRTPDRRGALVEIERLEARTKAAPTDGDARRELGEALFDGGRFSDALREWQEAERLSGRSPALLVRRGYAQLELDRLDEAEAAFRAALETDAAHAPALVGLAWLSLARDRPAAAQNAAERAVASDSRSAEALIVLGLSLLRQPGRVKDAGPPLRAALAAEPASYRYQAHAWQALTLLLDEDTEGALQQAHMATKLVPQSALAHGNLALVYFFAGRSREAVGAAQLAARLNPESPAASVALGQALLGRGDVEQAARAAARAAALDPKLPQAHYLLGVADAQRRDYRHAVRSLQEALRLAPDFLTAANALARAYQDMGRPAEAVALLLDLQKRHPDSDALLGALGFVYYRQARYNEGAEAYRKALKLRPNSALHQAELARLLSDANRLREAIAAGREAVRLAPEVAEYHATLGQIYKFSNLNSQAERHLRTAIALDPQNALALLLLGFTITGPDLRPANTGAGQAFIFDPAISTRLLRGGIHTEVSPRGGDGGQRGLNGFHIGDAADGRFHHIMRFRYNGADGNRINADTNLADVIEELTFVPGPRTRLSAYGIGIFSRQGLPGRASAPDRDDRAEFTFAQAGFTARQQIGPGNYLWLATNPSNPRGIVSDRDLNSLIVPPGLPASRLIASGSQFDPDLDVRLDLTLNRNSEQPGILTLGVHEVFRDLGNATLNLRSPAPPHGAIGQLLSRGKTDQTSVYAQLAQRVGRRFSFIAQVLHDRRHTENRILATLPGFPRMPATFEEDAKLLPSFTGTYQANSRTTFRLSANRRWTGGTVSLLAPTVTLLTTEPSSQPGGLMTDQAKLQTDPFNASQSAAQPETMSLIQADAERYLSRRDFLKLFGFRTAATRVSIGGLDFTGTGMTGGLPGIGAPSVESRGWESLGAGLRYERELNRNLYASVLLAFNHATTSDTPRTSFNGGTAPYEPDSLASLALDYIDPRGNKANLRVRRVGTFFADTGAAGAAGRPRVPGETYVDLRLAREPTVRTEYFLLISNLFNQRQLRFNGFPTNERRVLFGVTRRF